jgi:hypothetical protein
MAKTITVKGTIAVLQAQGYVVHLGKRGRNAVGTKSLVAELAKRMKCSLPTAYNRVRANLESSAE